MKNTRINRNLVFIFVIAAFGSLQAEGDGGQAGAFLRYGVGGRALGMGRAFVAVSNDASGVFWNPAGLMGAEQIEIGTMYTNLYFDSRYSHFGVVVPRPLENPKNKIVRFFLGPTSSIGFGWIGFGMVGFEQRTAAGELIGDFGIQENAFALAWSKEAVNPWGVFRGGLTLKTVNQNYSGLLPALETDGVDKGRDWSMGLDAGLTFQPIHAPIFRVFALRYVLPLRFGLSVQNLIQPGWKLQAGGRDPFPRVLRWGMGYRWVLKDWIPRSWETLQSLVNGCDILTALDWERYSGSSSGTYFGMEGRFPLAGRRLVWLPRFGTNTRSEGTSLGAGLAIPFAGTASVRLDYAYLIHHDLPNDTRFFLTFQFGKPRDPSFFKRLYERENRRDILLNILADYPNPDINGTVKLLADTDTKYSHRYNDLLVGLDRAEWLYQNTIELLKQNAVAKAKKKGADAAREYGTLFAQSENPLNDQQLMNYAETLILNEQMEAACTVLREVDKPSLRSYYLAGTSRKSLGNWDAAIADFDSAIKSIEVKNEPDVRSMDCLSALGLAESLLKNGRTYYALQILDDLLADCQSRLDDDYPRCPIFKDGYCIDDAQALSGVCLILMGRNKEGVTALLETDRFYPSLEYGRQAEKIANAAISDLQSNDTDALKALVQEFFDSYSKTHGLAAHHATGSK
jgi:tetratricopeptide (TPR) repeat protein